MFVKKKVVSMLRGKVSLHVMTESSQILFFTLTSLLLADEKHAFKLFFRTWEPLGIFSEVWSHLMLNSNGLVPKPCCELYQTWVRSHRKTKCILSFRVVCSYTLSFPKFCLLITRLNIFLLLLTNLIYLVSLIAFLLTIDETMWKYSCLKTLLLLFFYAISSVGWPKRSWWLWWLWAGVSHSRCHVPDMTFYLDLTFDLDPWMTRNNRNHQDRFGHPTLLQF